MAEFDDKLNSLLSNPAAMDQIMKMAQSLMGSEAASPAPAASGQQTGSAPPPPVQARSEPQIPPQEAWMPPASGSAGSPPASALPLSGPDLSFLSGLGSIDPKTIAALLPILRELGSTQNSSARQLLLSLRPYLKPERQDKVERALQLARLFRVGKQFLLRGDGHI